MLRGDSDSTCSVGLLYRLVHVPFAQNPEFPCLGIQVVNIEISPHVDTRVMGCKIYGG